MRAAQGRRHLTCPVWDRDAEKGTAFVVVNEESEI